MLIVIFNLAIFSLFPLFLFFFFFNLFPSKDARVEELSIVDKLGSLKDSP